MITICGGKTSLVGCYAKTIFLYDRSFSAELRGKKPFVESGEQDIERYVRIYTGDSFDDHYFFYYDLFDSNGNIVGARMHGN